MCDTKNSVLFTDTECLVSSPDFKLPDESQVLLRVPRENNMYNVNLKNIVLFGDLTCLFAKATLDESNLWHRRLAHINFKTINKLVKGNFVRGLPINFFENDNTCIACKKGKQHRVSCKTKPVSSVDQPLYRLHMDLFRPTFVKSLNKKSYYLVVTDDYNRFTWVFFLATKDETSPVLKIFITGLENQLSLKVKVIKSDNGTEFKNNDLNQFCEIKRIKREFSVPRTPQQNGIAERKNMTLIEAARTMLANSLLPIPFWAEAVNIACYVQNRVLVTKPHNKTPYELLHGRTPSIGFMRPFGYPMTILNTLDSLGKFEGKVDEGFLVGYFVNSKAFRVFNNITRVVQETFHVNFLENKPNIAGSGPTWLFDIDSLTRTINYQPVTAGNQTNLSAGFQDKFDAEKVGEEINHQYVLFPVWSSGSTNPQNNGRDAVFDGTEHDFDAKKPKSEVSISPSSSAQYLSGEFEDCSDNSINELNAASSIVPTVGQNSLNSTNTFSAAGPSNAAASPTYGKSSFIDASQLFDDPEMPELEDITYSDDEDDVGAEADFNNLETSITVSHIPITRVNKDHPVSQIISDLSSTTQTRSVTKVVQDQGGLLYMFNDDLHTYDIIFGVTNKDLCKSFEKLMKDKFQMSLIGELTSFLGLQVKQKKDGIFISQDKYVAEILRKFRLTEGKSASTSIDTEKPLLKDPDGEDVDVHIYSLMIGSLMYLTPSRPDIMFAVCACACFQVTPKASHLPAVKMIFRYLKGKTATGKEISNPCMAGSLPKTILLTGVNTPRSDEDRLELMELTVFLLPKVEKVRIGVNAVDLQVSAVRHMLLLLVHKLLLFILMIWCCSLSAVRSSIKQVHDITRLQALVDRMKVVITEATIRDALYLDDTEGVDYLPNEEIFTDLARMGYEKPSIMLTFYKAFFSSQWNLVRNVDSTTKFYMYPYFLQLIIRKQVGDLSTHTTKYASPALTQKVFANMRRVEKGFFRIETPLFKGMLVEQEIAKEGDATEHVEEVNTCDAAEGDDSAAHREVPAVQQTPPPSPQGRMIAEMDQDDAVVLKDDKEEDKDVADAVKDEKAKEDETKPAEVQEVVDVVTTAKLITKVVTAASETVTAASAIILTAET
nr:putative ribonuclease H-like domain-containing protein [Tanacetum cinerariifolium]